MRHSAESEAVSPFRAAQAVDCLEAARSEEGLLKGLQGFAERAVAAVAQAVLFSHLGILQPVALAQRA